MQAEPVEGLLDDLVFAMRRRTSEAPEVGSVGKLADGQRQAIEHRQLRIVRQRVEQPLPETIFDPAQIGGLADKGGAIHLRQGREEMGVVAAEVDGQGAVLARVQILADHFHRHHLAVVEYWFWSALAQPLPAPSPGALSPESNKKRRQ